MQRKPNTEMVAIFSEFTLLMLYIVLAYLMLFAALTNAVCLCNACIFAINFRKCFLFSCFVFVY